MRLISQDGMIDVPYENVCISINYRNKNQITAWNFGCEDCEIATMATYSTETKALKVMEMLRNKYSKFEIFKSVYQKGLLTELNKELGFDEMQNTLTPVFQFPADEEVDV